MRNFHRVIGVLAGGALLGGFATSALAQSGTFGPPTHPQEYVQIDERHGISNVNTLAALSGKVTADKGTVHAFRVKAHDLVHRIFYTVYTVNGAYSFNSIPAGSYEVFVLPYENAYTSPTIKLDIAPGEHATADIALTAREVRPPNVTYQTWDEIYPNEPGREELMQNCMGCHGKLWFHRIPRDRDSWAFSVNRMTSGSPTWAGTPMTHVSVETRDKILDYLARNFSPDKPRRDVRMDDRNTVMNEKDLGQALWTEYETNFPPPVSDVDSTPDGRNVNPGANFLHDPYISPIDGTIWYAVPGQDGFFNLNPRILSFRNRSKLFFAKHGGRNSWMHGITVDSRGHVWGAEISDGNLAELDPYTGLVVQHRPPHSDASILQVATDSKDNIWYGDVHGPYIGRYTAATGTMQDWPMPVPDSSSYGLTLDRDDNFWTVGWARNVVIKFNPKTNRFTEFFTQSVPSGTRRISVDKDNKVWFSLNSSEGIGVIEDARTGTEIKEYRTPLHYTEPYETWPDNHGTIWSTDVVYNSMIAFDAKSRRWGSYYPQPQADHWSVPKIEVDSEGTIWMGSRGVPITVAVKFQPKGNVARSFATAVVNSPNTKGYNPNANKAP